MPPMPRKHDHWNCHFQNQDQLYKGGNKKVLTRVQLQRQGEGADPILSLLYSVGPPTNHKKR